MLQEVLTAMKPDEAQVWLKKCIDSGLWVPGPSDESEDAAPPEQCKSILVAPNLTLPHLASPSLSSSVSLPMTPPFDITSGAKAVEIGPGTPSLTNSTFTSQMFSEN
jgi:hypothetical protein